ncbi:MAG TPA: YHYH protein [Verrucomicrobiae bacterium]|nr:YHYH protein [Verrucomicrobiae bacterium]
MRKSVLAGMLALGVLAQGCSAGAAGAPALASSGTSGGVGATTEISTAALEGIKRSHISLTALPLGDGKVSTTPKVGYVDSCMTSFNGGGADGPTPWIDETTKTWNLETKPTVEGSVTWTSELKDVIDGAVREITGNGLPSEPTGIFPIQPSDPAHKYDGNPNSIEAQNVADDVPANPTVAKTPSCLPMGPIGVTTDGAQFFNALDAAGRDGGAHEIFDKCGGHPDQSDTYHYHMVTSCLSDPGTGHSKLIGYALDGFGIYGHRGENGKILTDADLDACHGHTHAILWHGKMVVMYHYHATYEYPYTVGCFRGTPAESHRGPG